MRRTVALTLFLLVLAPLGLTAPASAGGPTSVLVSAAGEERVAGLYYSDPAYVRLSELVGMGQGVGAANGPGADPTGRIVTMTWLLHEVTPWRLDRVFIDSEAGDGLLWISTQENLGGGSLWDAPTVWHRAPASLADVVERVLAGEDGQAGLPPSPAAVQTPAAAVDTVAETPAGDENVLATPMLLALGGVAGLVVGAALTLILTRRHATPTPIRQRSPDRKVLLDR